MKIKSIWTVRKGTWNERQAKFINVTSVVTEKELEMVIEEREAGKILRFNGGPTGFEAYYIKDLLDPITADLRHDQFCICAGTINRWAKCEVDWKTVRDFITGTL